MGDNGALAEKAYKIAYEYDGKFGCCPQCVIAAVQETLGGISDDVFKAAYPLAGGGALCGDGMCGALAGGFLAIGAFHGRERKNFNLKAPKAFKIAKALREKFDEQYSGITCQAVQKKIIGRSFDLWNADEYQAFDAAGGHTDKCTAVSGNVAKWAVQLLQLERESAKK